MTPLELPIVPLLMMRRFTPTGWSDLFGGVLVLDRFEVEDVGLADGRLAYDEDAVDCSRRIFQITTTMMLWDEPGDLAWACFPSRRWRNLRTGAFIDQVPDPDHPLLYIGNPVRIFKRQNTLHVVGRGEFVIKSGMELGF